MELADPPDVAGWQAWYLAPNYNQLWINTASIPNRAKIVNFVVSWGIRPHEEYDKLYLDPFKLAYFANDPSDINDLVATFVKLLFPQPASDDLITELKDLLNQGLPDFEWTDEWNKYVNNPDDENQKKAISNNLKRLLFKMCSMAEYQLI